MRTRLITFPDKAASATTEEKECSGTERKIAIVAVRAFGEKRQEDHSENCNETCSETGNESNCCPSGILRTARHHNQETDREGEERGNDDLTFRFQTHAAQISQESVAGHVLAPPID
ncbi:hypothetical protein [Erythrobacter westpacificensis]|uniref:hypothetical protein n=1 Tax=Erythrobacter westpacificensis TaxID=1055231 RepID=UPI0031F7E0F6